MRVVTTPSLFTDQDYWQLIIAPGINGPMCTKRNNKKNELRTVYFGECLFEHYPQTKYNDKCLFLMLKFVSVKKMKIMTYYNMMILENYFRNY